MRVARGAITGYARQLNETNWLTVLGYAWLLFLGLTLLLVVTPDAWRAPVKALGLALPLMLLAAKDLASIPDVAARMRALRRQGAGWGRWLAACLPPGLIGLARLDRAIWRDFFCWLRRQPTPARPSGLKLTYVEQGAYSAAVGFGLLTVLVELPLDAALVPLFFKDAAMVRNIHLAVALGSIYTLAWLLGDRWRVRDGYHVLTATHLDLQVGARASACIPLDAIEDAQALRQPVLQWRRAHPYRDIEAVNITPFDKPNLVLRLRADAACTITHHGIERSGVRYVFLYLDRPQQLLHALAA
ncbi:hypothetical protein [Massilia niabensis]|uniref:Uncharacterized protein n=1 Tax=Massilia niabensis TaxID=544910 RepID=A0ABW0L3R3_9BURK